MTVLYAKLTNVDGDWSVTEDWRTDRKYRCTWVVVTDDDDDLAITVLSYADIPDYGDTFAYGNDTDAYAICRRVTASRPDPQGAPKHWVVTAEFGRLGRTPDEPADPTQPWTRSARWSIQQADYMAVFDEDVAGAAVRNSAGQRYDPPAEVERANTLIHVTYYKAALKLSVLDQYRYSINNATFWGYAAERLRINQLVADEQEENGVNYWEVRVQVEAKADDGSGNNTWAKRILDEGVLERVWVEGSGSGSGAGAWTYVLPTDDNDVTHTVSHLLDGDGGPLGSEGDAGSGSGDDAPAAVFNEYDGFVARDFTSSDLALPAFPAHLSYS